MTSVIDRREGSAVAVPVSWWRDAVIYQIYPRSFADSDGDGMGDLPGIRGRLPYLRDLGVDAVWLSPFYASPQADAGYDVADYRTVDPVFGTLADAQGLIADAHDLGLRVIVDLVPNHSSDRHEWFRRALAEGPGSPFRDRYHFRPGRGAGGELPPNDWPSIFGGPAWTRTANPDGTPGEWYLHLFAPEQPDFDWDHPAVADEFRTILRFWLDLGVDGFRIDVAHGLVKAQGLPDLGVETQWHLLDVGVSPCFDRDGVHDIYRSWRRILDEYPGERIAVAEAWAPTLERVAAYVRPDELHQAFNFSYLGTGWNVADQRRMIDASLAAMRAVGAPATWTLSNHDVVRHTNRLLQADDGDVAGRRPTAVDPVAGLRRARAASLLLLALPGSAYLYQGEELGLPEVVDLPPEVRQDPAFHRAAGQDGYRDGCRVPIPWHGDRAPYGFGPDGGPSWLPQPPAWAQLSVAAQENAPGSTLSLYRAALAIRRSHPGLGAPDNLRWADAPADVLTFDRDGFRCTVNMGAAPVRVDRAGEVLLASGPIDAGPDAVVLPPDTAVWWSR
ncbi:glycoside hydrolase family 13 protein [Couchioplanes caeruleus]|uniref:glycoside hydrolase family 13 protein n=1 Tax=Couchioplanes caeruleus TaxID=56438 RepID=UPI0020BDA10F|nr:glycoside hydrolase family 13 protein [Couchioplanes caeruleus]UQU62912.1 glycoside hydrolase family 13 protein [Couchioplanes caeruleus]